MSALRTQDKSGSLTFNGFKVTLFRILAASATSASWVTADEAEATVAPVPVAEASLPAPVSSTIPFA